MNQPKDWINSNSNKKRVHTLKQRINNARYEVTGSLLYHHQRG